MPIVAAADVPDRGPGLDVLADAGLTRRDIEARNPALVHVSVTRLRQRRSAFALARRRTGGLRDGRRAAADRRAGSAAGEGSPRRLHLPCGDGGGSRRDGGALLARRHGHGQHVDVSIQEVAFSRNVNGVLVWQFDRRKLHRVGGALNYGQATVRCIWPLADGWCFHTLMTGRFGAPANQGLSDWMDEAGARQSAARRRLAALQPLDAGCRRPARTGKRRSPPSSGRAPAPRSAARVAGVASTPAWSNRPRMCCRIRICRRATSGSAGCGLREPSRFARFARGRRAVRPRGTSAAPLAPQRAPARLPACASWISPGRWSDRSPPRCWATWAPDVIKVETRTRPCLSRLDVQVSASRADDFDDKPWFAHLNTSKRSLALDLKRPEVARSDRSAAGLGRCGRREFLARHDGQAGPGLRTARRAAIPLS